MQVLLYKLNSLQLAVGKLCRYHAIQWLHGEKKQKGRYGAPLRDQECLYSLAIDDELQVGITNNDLEETSKIITKIHVLYVFDESPFHHIKRFNYTQLLA